MRRAAGWMGLGGLALGLALVASQGVGEVWAILTASGWCLALIGLYHPVQTLADTAGWRRLIPRRARPALLHLAWIRWIGESVNALLPVASVGGELVKVRLLAAGGVRGAVAGATVMVDLTVGLLGELVFAVLGVGLVRGRQGGGPWVAGLAAGLAVGALAVGGFYGAQRRGLLRILTQGMAAVLGAGPGSALVGGGAELDREVGALYRRRRDLAVCFLWRLASWVLGAGEVWLALRLLGNPVGWADALVLESLGQAVRSLGFFVPGALGVQEGGFLVLGALVGLPAEAALALSLAKRVRELELGLPGLLAWSVAEGRRLLPGEGPVRSEPGR